MITGNTRAVAVFGYPIGHSLSPVIHNAAFRALGIDYVYIAFSVEPALISEAIGSIRTLRIAGANITIPHKVAVLAYLDIIDEKASMLGNVNTIVNDEGVLTGYNTDGRGISRSLLEAGVCVLQRDILIIGAGGVARTAVAQMVVDGAASVTIVNRRRERAEDLLEWARGIPSASRCEVKAMSWPDVRLAKESGFSKAIWPSECIEAVSKADVIIQTTPVGMSPNTDDPPSCPVEALHTGQCVFELVYNPLNTALVHEARKRGCIVIDGSALFIFQAAESFRLWTGIDAPVDVMEHSLREHLNRVNPS